MTTERTTCQGCDAVGGADHLGRMGNVNYVRCRYCGLVQGTPDPPPDDLTEIAFRDSPFDHRPLPADLVGKPFRHDPRRTR